MNGQPVDGFMGALPEGPGARVFDRHLPSVEEVEADEAESEEALDALAEGDTASALEHLQHAVATDPANDEVRFDYVKLLQLGREDDAKVAFAPVIARRWACAAWGRQGLDGCS